MRMKRLLAPAFFCVCLAAAAQDFPGWKINSCDNKDSTMELAAIADCPVPDSALRLDNFSSDKAGVVGGPARLIVEPGMYQFGVWAKAAPGLLPLKNGKAPELTLLVHHDAWKKNGGGGRSFPLRDGWLRYDVKFQLSAADLPDTYRARIIVSGKGSAWLAGPTFERLPDSAAPRTRPPLLETARLSFDQGLDSPVKAVKAKLVPGFRGQGVEVEDGGTLLYGVDKLLKGENGAIAVWVNANRDAIAPLNPADDTALCVAGKDELGASKRLFDCRAGSFSIASAYGNLGVPYYRPMKQFFKDEWRHLIFCWDKDTGLRIYLDGRPFRSSELSKERFASLPQLKLEKLQLLTATGKDPDDRAVMDELRLFTRALTEDEARALYSEYVPAYPVLLDYAQTVGDKLPLRVKMLQDKPAAFAVVVEDTAGKRVFAQKLEVAKPGDYEIPFHAPAPGDYRLSFAYEGKRIRTFEITAISPKTITAAMPESISGEVKMKLVDAVDCAADYSLNRYVDDGHCAVVNSPLGPYREALDEEKNSGFAYNFDIKSPGRPHWLEIEYPDDKARTFYVVVEQELGGHGYSQCGSADTIGVANGINNPVTGKFQTKRLLFWPDAKRIMVGAFVYKPLSGQAGPALRSVRLYENDGPLPRLAVNPPKDMPERGVGPWNEDPTFPAGLWFKRDLLNVGPSFAFWRDKLERQIQYLRFTGQNQTVLQLFTYTGENNGAVGVLPQEGNGAGYLPGWACLAATTYEREGVPFHIQFNDRDGGLAKVIGLEKVSENFVEAAAKGQDAIESITASGELSEGFNFLHPAVREAHLKRVRFYAEQFGRLKTFRGSFYMMGSLITFRDERTGYEDYTVALFERETGTKIPVAATGLDRFGKRYEWLKANAWDKWLDWRCAQVKTFLLELSAALGGDGRTLVLPLSPPDIEAMPGYPAPIDLLQAFRSMGVDLPALSHEPTLRVEPESRPNYALLYAWRKMSQDMDSLWYTDSFARLFQDNAFPSLMLVRHANMEVYGWEAPITKYWWPMGYWGDNGRMMAFSTALPDNKYLPQTLAWSLANCDPWRVEHGWWGNPENGGVERFQKFYQAYRSIPAVHFEPAPGVNDPAMVRRSGEWFYVVNQQYYQTKVKIAVEAAELTDAVHNRPVKVNSGVLELTLEPYQVCCFRAAKALGELKVEQIVPPEIVVELTNTVEKLKKGARLEPSPLAKAAEELLTAKRYSALYYLTRSYSARKLLEAADKALDVKASLNPDSNALDVRLWNRDSAPVAGSLAGKAFSLQPGEKVVLGITSGSGMGVPPMGFAGGTPVNPPEKTTGGTPVPLPEVNVNLELVANGVSKSLTYKFRPVSAAKAKDIKIDGDLSDWAQATWRKLNPCEFTIGFKPPLSYSQTPFPSEFAWAWDESGLNLALKVEEKDYLPSPSKEAAWQHDSLEIMVDQANDAREGFKETDKNDLTFFLDGENAPAPGGLAAVKREGGTTCYEAFIPASALPEAELRPGANIGFALKLHNREHVRADLDSWGIMVSCPEYPCGRPDRWGDLLLSGKTL